MNADKEIRLKPIRLECTMNSVSRFALIWLLLIAPALWGQSGRPPNIVLIMADDMGREALGNYGGASYETPAMDKLAKEGVRFTQAYSLPLCTNTRVSLMTGKYNFRNWKAFGILDPQVKTFGHWFSEGGYHTCISGKWQLQSYNPIDFQPEWRGKGMRVEDAGFDEYFLWHSEHTEDKGSRYADPHINSNGTYLEDTEGKYGPDLYVDYINDFMERHRDKPFFVYYSMALPHGPFNPTPDHPDWRVDRFASDPKYYTSMVEYVDKSVGRILQQIDALGLQKDTLVVFFSDNGTPEVVTSKMADGSEVSGGKGQANLRGTHVPLLIQWAGASRHGHVVDELVDTNDIVPTLFDAAGISLPKGEIFDGESLLPQVRGELGKHRDWLYFYFDPHPGAGKERRKKRVWAMTRGYKLADGEGGALYNLSEDPDEGHPIYSGDDSREMKAARKKLRRILNRFNRQM